MEMTELLLFAWGLALLGAVTAALVVRAIDGVLNHGADAIRRLRGE